MIESIKMPKPCCEKFKNISITYLDLVVAEDDSLQLLISLLSRLNDYDPIEAEEARKIAEFLDAYLNRKIVREHYFLGRSLEPCTFDSSDLEAEICRVHGKLRPL
jgi:hypothetical protein